MRWHRIIRWASMGLILVGVGAMLSCSKKSDKTTNVPVQNLELDSPNLAQGGTYDHPFSTTVTSYTYHCKFHSSMHGTVTVASGSPMSVNVTIASFAFSPNPAVVGPGGAVHWVNNDSATHTVTSDSPNP